MFRPPRAPVFQSFSQSSRRFKLQYFEMLNLEHVCSTCKLTFNFPAVKSLWGLSQIRQLRLICTLRSRDKFPAPPSKYYSRQSCPGPLLQNTCTCITKPNYSQEIPHKQLFHSSSSNHDKSTLSNPGRRTFVQKPSTSLYISPFDVQRTASVEVALNPEERFKDIDQLRNNVQARGMDIDVDVLVS